MRFKTRPEILIDVLDNKSILNTGKLSPLRVKSPERLRSDFYGLNTT